MGDPRFYELRDLLHNDMAAALKRIHVDKSLLDVRSGLGETLLHWYAIEYREDIVKALAGMGAEIDPQNRSGNTPLLEAALSHRKSMCRLLLSLGASPDTMNYLGDRPLINAARAGSLKICRLLVENGAKIDAQDSNQETVVSVAATSGQLEVLDYFLERLGPDFDVNLVFGDSDADLVHHIGGHVADLLARRGLRHPFRELMDSVP